MYEIKRKDLRGKLSIDDALVQTGLDSGWGCFVSADEQVKLEDVNDKGREYLKKSALGYIGAGDPVLISRLNQYYKEVQRV